VTTFSLILTLFFTLSLYYFDFRVNNFYIFCLVIFDDHEFLLHDVGYVPELKQNLLSLSRFYELIYATKIKHVIIEVSHNIKIIAKCTK